MNLQRVSRYNGREIRLICSECGVWTPDDQCYANLDGKPFKDYYCEPCSNNLKQGDRHE
jgi:hypothetical protein